MTQDFKKIQHDLAAWLRAEDDAEHGFDTIEPRRLAIYRRLIHNNIRQFLDAGFPVLQEVLTSAQWRALCNRFVSQHHAASPLFSSIGSEFVDFIATLDVARLATDGYPPWLFELAHYERLEVEVLHAVFDETLETIAELSDDTQLHLNPTARLAIYNYPVASVSQQHLPQEPLAEPYCVLVYRKLDAAQAQFMQINTITALAITELQRGEMTFAELFQQLQEQLPNQNPEALAQGLLTLIQDFCARFVLFTRS